MNQEIKFQCSNCEQKMLVDATAVGLTIACPGCGLEQVVPAMDIADSSEPETIRPRSNSVPEFRSAPKATRAESMAEIMAPDVRQELIAASVQNSRLESQVTEMRQQIKKLRGDLQRVTAERDEARSLIAQMEPELDQAQENLATYERHVDGLQQQIRQGEVDVTEARQLLTDTQAERTVALREIQSLQQRLETQDQELAALRAELTAATSKIAEIEADLAKTRDELTTQQQTAESLRADISELTRERDSLRRSVSESGLGQELVSVREQLATAEKECKRLNTHARQLTSDLTVAEKARTERDDLIRTLKTELDQARRAAEAASEIKMRNDNEVLRGIIARQNTELEQKHVQLVRLKRARLAVQLAYAAFALALAAIAIWAVKMVPGLKLGKLLDF